MQDTLLKEIKIFTSRSSGPGGQHVNKTESRVELHWNLHESTALTDEQKAVLLSRIGSRLKENGVLIMVSQESRSQLHNREDVKRRFLILIEKNIKPRRKRIDTKPSKASVERRLKEKKETGEKKKGRGGEWEE